MKKFFGGGKKKTKSRNEASIIGGNSGNIPAKKLQVSRSTEQPQHSLLTDGNNYGSKFTHNDSQGTMATQPALTKRLHHRPTSSPPALVMPRPRYAEPPTRAVLKSYEQEKTQLEPSDTAILHQLSTPLSQAETQTENTPLPQYIDDDDKLYMTSAAPHSFRQDQKIRPMPAPISIRPRKVSPIIALPPQYDVNPTTIRNKKSLDGSEAEPHESMDSLTGSDDSNRVYETALESPVASTSTFMDHHPTLTNIGTGQPRRHSSHISFSIPHCELSSSSSSSPPPPETTIFDSPITVTQHTLTPNMDSHNSTDTTQPIYSASPTTKSSHNHDVVNHTTRQTQGPGYVKSLQQQVMVIQQQRTMDRLEYESMEQVHKERTQWMKAEIDRTQAKLLELTALEQGQSPTFIQDQHDDTQQQQQQQEFSDNSPHLNGMTRTPSPPLQSRHLHSSTSSSLSSSSRLKKSKSGDSLPHLSRSSSKVSTGGRSSSGGGGHGYHRPMDDYSQTSPMDKQAPSFDLMIPAHPTHARQRTLPRRNSGSYQQNNHQIFYLQQQQQQWQRQQVSPRRSIPPSPRQQQRPRPRSKSTDARQPPDIIEMGQSYHRPDAYYMPRPPSRPRSNDSRRYRYQRSHSVERSEPLLYDDGDDRRRVQRQHAWVDDFEDDVGWDGQSSPLDGFSPKRHLPGMAWIPPVSHYDIYRSRRPPSSRMDYPPLPPPFLWQQQQHYHVSPPGDDDTHYWPPSPDLTDMGPPFHRYPRFGSTISPMWLDDMARPPRYWRARPSSSSEYTM